jgi:tetratricopeptide (TPR) repeat protein
VDEGLRFIFDGWDVTDPFTLYEQGGLTAIDKHYAELSARLGFPVAVPNEVLFMTFSQLEGRKRFAEAQQVIDKVIAASPESVSALYYSARLQAQMGIRPLAIETLKRALLLSPNDRASRSLVEYMKLDPNEFAAPVRLAAKDLAKFVGGYGASAVRRSAPMPAPYLSKSTIAAESPVSSSATAARG